MSKKGNQENQEMSQDDKKADTPKTTSPDLSGKKARQDQERLVEEFKDAGFSLNGVLQTFKKL